MGHMFCSTERFNQPLDSWDVSSVRNMDGMFLAAWAFHQPLGRWDVSRVTDMRCLFEDSLVFAQPLGDWDVGRVRNLMRAFQTAHAARPQIVDGWRVAPTVVCFRAGFPPDAPLQTRPRRAGPVHCGCL